MLEYNRCVLKCDYFQKLLNHFWGHDAVGANLLLGESGVYPELELPLLVTTIKIVDDEFNGQLFIYLFIINLKTTVSAF